jgi:hypothetical protein
MRGKSKIKAFHSRRPGQADTPTVRAHQPLSCTGTWWRYWRMAMGLHRGRGKRPYTKFETRPRFWGPAIGYARWHVAFFKGGNGRPLWNGDLCELQADIGPEREGQRVRNGEALRSTMGRVAPRLGEDPRIENAERFYWDPEGAYEDDFGDTGRSRPPRAEEDADTEFVAFVEGCCDYEEHDDDRKDWR